MGQAYQFRDNIGRGNQLQASAPMLRGTRLIAKEAQDVQ